MNKSVMSNFFVCLLAAFFVFSITAIAFGETAKAKLTYEITVSSGANGQVTPATRTVREGNKATFRIIPSAGYLIDTITVDGTNIDLSAVKDLSKPYRYAFDNVIAVHTLNATFQLIPSYEITVSSGDNGRISPSTKTVRKGGNAAFTIKPDKGYFIDKIVVDGSDVDISQVKDLSKQYTVGFKEIDSIHTISATYKVIVEYPTVLTGSGANGLISPSRMGFRKGANATFTVTPSGGYITDAITIDGKYIDLTKIADLSEPYKINFNKLYDDYVINAIFKAQDAGPSVPNPFAGHYTGHYNNEGKAEVTISFTVDEKGMATATFNYVKDGIIRYGAGIADTEKITLFYDDTKFDGSFSSQDGVIGITGGKWGWCPCVAVEPPLVACSAPCVVGTWTAQQDKE